MRKIVIMLATTMMFSMTASAMETAPTEATAPEATTSEAQAFEMQYSEDAGALQDYSHNFGRVRVGRTAWASFTLRNTGWRPMLIRNIRMQGFDYSQSNNCPRVVRLRDRCTFQIRFTPHNVGPSRGRLVIRTDSDRIRLHLMGRGVDRRGW